MASTSLLPTNTTTCLLWLLLARALAVPSSIADIEPTQSPGGFGTQDAQHTAYSTSKHVLQLMHRYLGVVQMVQLIAVGSLIGAIGLWRKRRAAQHGESAEVGSNKVKRVDRSILHESPKNSFDAKSTDPGLLKKHSTIRSYKTSLGTYPRIRTFYRPHAQADKLPSVPTPLPILVFVHGLGGSLAQFNPLLTSLINIAPCLGIDLPGCGLSEFFPKSWEHYTLSALAELLAVVIGEHLDKDDSQGVVLIGHSLGCSLSALLASPLSTNPVNKREINVLGLIAVCPRASAPTVDQIGTYRRLLCVPTPIFDIWRRWDRRGGPNSASVARFVGPNADDEAKRLQERFNAQSQTAVWRRMAWGILPARGDEVGKIKGTSGLPGLEIWVSLQIPLFLIAGASDNVTKPEEVLKITEAVRSSLSIQSRDATDNQLAKSSGHSPEVTEKSYDEADMDKTQDHSTASTETTIIKEAGSQTAEGVAISSNYSRKQRVLKTSVLPAPASHALLYDPTTFRTLSGLIQTFLYDHVDSRLSLGWQLQHLTTGGKWDVKNLAKWQSVKPVSEPVAGIFRAMKTLRQIDDTHNPEQFVRQWRGKIRAVVDISHDSPVYDPKDLDEGGIPYHKFPTVSKIPPLPEETHDFIKLIDRLRSASPAAGSEDALIGVHCHYGFNRTGFFLCSYLIEREGYGVQQAIDEFSEQRPPGIRHEHFQDTLFVRYCVGLKRAPTL